MICELYLKKAVIKKIMKDCHLMSEAPELHMHFSK